LKKRLSVFSFEGLLLRYPVDEGSQEEWLKDPSCLFYPDVPDLPGAEAWDHFACSFLKRAIKAFKNDVIVFSAISVQEPETNRRISHLLKTIGAEVDEIIRRKPEDDLETFYRKNLVKYLNCTNGRNQAYCEVDLYVNDLELAKVLANFIIEEFSVTAIIHDLYSD
jgi:hypothetical protein